MELKNPAIRRGVISVAVAFVVSRLLLLGAGIRLNTEALQWYWQVLDPQLLGSRLIESIWFLHCQPPLFNFGLGLVLKVAPHHFAVVFHLLFSALGLGLAVTCFLVLAELGVGSRPAALLVIVASLSPSWVVYESWLFYDFPVAVLLAIATLALLKSGREQSVRWMGLFFVAVGCVSLLRSLHHVLWLGAATVLALGCLPRRRRTVAVVAVVPVLVVLGLCMKNAVVFGFFGQSSWLGMSLNKMTSARLQPEARQSLVRSGRLSLYSTVRPFSEVAAYERVAGVSRFDDSPPTVLGQRRKSTGHPNFNHRAYIGVSKVLQDDALIVIQEDPETYLRAVVTAVRRFFSSCVAYPPFAENLAAIFPIYRLGEATWNQPMVSVVMYLVAMAAAGLGWGRAHRTGDRGLAAAAAFVLLNLAWVLVVGCLIEVGENHRFRFSVLPMVCVAVVGGLTAVTRRERPETPE